MPRDAGPKVKDPKAKDVDIWPCWASVNNRRASVGTLVGLGEWVYWQACRYPELYQTITIGRTTMIVRAMLKPEVSDTPV